jgi:hypothetical protein
MNSLKNASLDDRVAAALKDHATSAAVAALMDDVETATVSAAVAAENARALALDPTLSPADVAAARREIGDCAFRRERLQEAGRRLAERLIEVEKSEDQDRLREEYQRVSSERDKLAAELAEIYPDVERRLSDLVGRIAANDREVAWVNSAGRLPNGEKRLLPAELVARGLGGLVRNGVQSPAIVEELRLPKFQADTFEPYAWPQR